MASGSDEEQARVNAQVALLEPFRLLLLPHVNLMLVIDKVDDGGPRVAVVDIVAESGGVNHGQLDFERLFFQFGFDDFHLGSETFDKTRIARKAGYKSTSVSLSSCLTCRRW